MNHVSDVIKVTIRWLAYWLLSHKQVCQIISLIITSLYFLDLSLRKQLLEMAWKFGFGLFVSIPQEHPLNMLHTPVNLNQFYLFVFISG